MKKIIVLLMVTCLVLPFVQDANAFGKKKKKKMPTEQTTLVRPPVKKTDPYAELLKGAKTVKGDFITLHNVKGKIFFEMPVKYFNREMLLASTMTASNNSMFCLNGFKSKDPMHIKFVMIDSTIYMCDVNTSATFDEKEAVRMEKVKKLNFLDPMRRKFKREAYNTDSTAVVFDASVLFNGGEPALAPIESQSSGLLQVSVTPKTDLTIVGEMKAFDDNIMVKSTFSYDYSMRIMMFDLGNGPLTIEATRTLLLLPEEKMRPRISDSRIGIFLTDKQYISNEEDGLQNYTLANRWRLEPKDMEAWKRGELVEPIKPIVYYIDDAFPELWRKAAKEGTLRWNKAFEKIGFKNVIQVRDFPKDDPEFDPDNLKYSCIRYVPSYTANAMGPSWVDPTTGEIINASVIVYNDVIKLNNQWRFVQTAQIDPSVRGKKLPDDIVYETLAYVIGHEVGHTLGLMHNMGASSAFPVDSLRSANFTKKYGTTPSIMDYARFNYVAQPGDKGVKLTPPDLGVYDEFVIKWLYTYFPDLKNADEENKVLEKWVDEKAGDPLYRFRKQQMLARLDPSAIEEDLGDDPVKAADYGIKNLKYILKNMNNWITDDPDGSYRKSLYNTLVSQYARYLQNVIYNVGGIYLTDVKDGTPGERVQPVDREVQRASLKWVLKQINDCDWLNNKEVTKHFGPDMAMSARVQNMAIMALFKAGQNVVLASHISNNSYSLEEYCNDLYDGVWESAIANRKVTQGDKIMQKNMLAMMKSLIKPSSNNLLGSLLGGISNEVGSPSWDEVELYGLYDAVTEKESIEEMSSLGMTEQEKINEVLNSFGFGYGYGWQRPVKTDIIDETLTNYCAIGVKLRTLLMGKAMNATDQSSKQHYQAMLFMLMQMMDGIKL